ncbi:MAG: AmmeMemoRadiSam system protein B [Acidobacteriota bacterium]
MSKLRRPAVAGLFYPAEAAELRGTVAGYLEQARERAPGPQDAERPRALIAPHAGYVYSGPIAASAFVRLEPFGEQIRRVLLLGPSHFVPLRGLATAGVEAFSTPLGDVAVDQPAETRLSALAQVIVKEAAHAREHSLEVELPFLQTVLGSFELVALVTGEVEDEEVAEVIDELADDGDTLVVVSSDLSHYHDYDTARGLDGATASAIEELRPDRLGEGSACGRAGIRGLLVAAHRWGLSARAVDLRNSGDTAGPRAEVVGYGAFVFF